MRKTLAALALASAGALALPALSYAQSVKDNTGWFVNGNVGRTSINQGAYDDHDTGYGANFGYRWGSLGVEGGYTDFGNISPKNVFNDQPVVADNKAKLHGWNVGVNTHYNIAENWYLSGRAGVWHWNGKGVTDDPTPVYRDTNGTDYYAGVGFGYDFANNVSVGLNYDYYKADKRNLDLTTDMASVSAEYRF